jgi:hypothetical protein
MATYKVPQDVEADDKLLGPFSFRQFVYLMIVAGFVFLAWGLAQLFIGLAIIPLPVIIFFGALALPLRKDQPMEIYLAAIVSFYLKPHRRLWDAEGVETMIEITAPKTVEVKRTKDLSQNEAAQRLNYLANIVDTQGWAIRGVAGGVGTAMNTDAYLEAQGTNDVLDTTNSVAQNFDQMMMQSTERMREEARQRMMQATQVTAPAPVAPVTPSVAVAPEPAAMTQPVAPITPVAPASQPAPITAQTPAAQPIPVTPAVSTPIEPTQPAPHFNPYPDFQQSVIQPLNDTAHQAEVEPPTPEPIEEKPASTSDSTPSAGIINLANNADLSIETIAHEANRLKKAEESEEVVISLR